MKSSEEVLIGTRTGVVRAWAVRRLEEAEKWDRALIKVQVAVQLQVAWLSSSARPANPVGRRTCSSDDQSTSSYRSRRL